MTEPMFADIFLCVGTNGHLQILFAWAVVEIGNLKHDPGEEWVRAAGSPGPVRRAKESSSLSSPLSTARIW